MKIVKGLLVTAAALSLALVSGTAQAAAARDDGKSRPVFLIHGISFEQGTSCAAGLELMTNALKNQGFTGDLLTFGFYDGDRDCDVTFPGTLQTPLQEVGRQLAWTIYNRYTKYGKSVDIAAHSLGGVISKAALAGVGRKGWPSRLYVQDVVTLGSPHRGTAFAETCADKTVQCRDLLDGSPFLSFITGRDPGTDYTYIGATGDTVSPPETATNGRRGDHWVIYQETGGKVIDHGGLAMISEGTWNAEYRNKPGRVRQGRLEAPLVHLATALEKAGW